MKPFLTVLALLLVAHPAGAQGLAVRGFAGVAATSTVNREWYQGAGGGVTVDLGTPWVGAGAQGEALISWPYFAGRGAVFGQFNAVPRSSVRPFVLAGTGFGEDSGPLVGAGVEVHAPNSRHGFRLSVEDYVHRYTAYSLATLQPVKTTGHQVAVRVALLF
jgi:hypothetical protein